jgi:hypothetical protein
MIPAFVCLAALNQKAPTVDYSVPLGASTQFHETVLQIKTKLAAKDFGGASSLAKSLPQSVITYRFNFNKVPKDSLDSFKQSSSFAIASWQKSLDGKATLVESKNGVPNILVSFEPVLQKTPDTNEVPGVALFFGASASEPKVEAVVALKRTAQLVETTPTEAFNEVMYGIGSYLGLAPSPVPGSAMGRVNGRMAALNLVARDEGFVAESNLRLAKALRVAALSKIVVKPTRPQLSVSDRVLQFKPAFQGDTVYEFVTVTNKGDAPLNLKAFGDCSCISGDVLPVLKPGESTALKGRYRTEELVGDIEHNVVLISNDPDQPSQKFAAKIRVEPRAEVIYPTSDTLVLDGGDKKLTFYIHSAEPIKWNILKAQLVPLDSKVIYEPFEGDVTDWRAGGKLKHVKGYKVTTDFTALKDEQVFGRIAMTVYAALSNPNLKLVRAPIYIQKGIVAQPERIYLGAPTGPSETFFVVSRPGKPFKILSATSDSKHVSVQVVSNKLGAEYRMSVKYDGKAPEHRLDTQIRIATDSDKQPTIILPLTTAQS